MKKLFYNYYKRHLLKREAKMRNWSEIRTILILTPQPVPDIEQELQQEGKKTWTVFLPGEKEVNWVGRPSPELMDAAAIPVDLLIDLQQNETLTGNYLTLASAASLCIGRRREEEGLLDVMMDMPAGESVRPLYEQIRKYLRVING